MPLGPNSPLGSSLPLLHLALAQYCSDEVNGTVKATPRTEQKKKEHGAWCSSLTTVSVWDSTQQLQITVEHMHAGNTHCSVTDLLRWSSSALRRATSASLIFTCWSRSFRSRHLLSILFCSLSRAMRWWWMSTSCPSNSICFRLKSLELNDPLQLLFGSAIKINNSMRIRGCREFKSASTHIMSFFMSKWTLHWENCTSYRSY